MCVVTLADYVMVHGKLPGEEMNASVGTGGVSETPFGWRELGGLVRYFATDASENVYVGDSVSVFDEVHINFCYSWCVYGHEQTNTRATFRYTFARENIVALAAVFCQYSLKTARCLLV